MYNRGKAVEYAHEWAYGRNPRYLNFNGIGGDCTNFVSQCLYAGGAKMNYTPDLGWYYNSAWDRTASWTGVQYLYNFLTGEHSTGPHGTPVQLEHIEIGDVIQLAFSEGFYAHTLIVVARGNYPNMNNTLIACHSADSDYRPLGTFNMYSYRCLKITA